MTRNPDPARTDNGKDQNTLQQQKDEIEKRKHSASENALESTQDKNPVPEGTRREE